MNTEILIIVYRDSIDVIAYINKPRSDVFKNWSEVLEFLRDQTYLHTWRVMFINENF